MKRFFLSLLAVACVLTSIAGTSFSDHGSPLLSDYQRGVISYFHEVALGFEYGTAARITRKWKTTMKIYVGGSADETLLRELNQVIGEINALATDGFFIQIVNTRAESNYFVFWGSSADYARLYPGDANLAKHNSGVFHIYWNKSNEIVRGNMFVNTVGRSIEEQRHVLREELTQSLGLGNDSPTHPESVFQQKWTIPLKYAEIDKDLIRLLYHPKMAVGMNSHQVFGLITEIFLFENGA